VINALVSFNMPDKSEPKEKTPNGFEVRIPKRSEVLANLKKIAKPGKPSATRRPKQ
jgi:hypothetical protein